MAYKQPLVTVPPYVGISLCIEGQALRKPQFMMRQSRPSEPSIDGLFAPRATVMRQTFAERLSEKKNANLILNNTGSSSAGKVLGTTGQNKKDNNDSTVSKSAVNFTSRTKDAPTKIGPFRENGADKNNKVKSNAASHAVNGHDNTVDSGNDDRKTDKPNGHLEKRTRTTESKKSDSVSTIVESDTNLAVPRIGDSHDLKVQNGLPTQPHRMLPNTPYLAGLNQCRYVSKTSVSANYTIPIPPGGDRATISKTLAVNNVESTDLQTFKASFKGNSELKVLAFPGGKMKKTGRKKKKKRNTESSYLPSAEPESLAFHLPKVPYAGSLSVEQSPNSEMSTAPTIPSMPTKLKYFTRPAEMYNINNYSLVGAVDRA